MYIMFVYTYFPKVSQTSVGHEVIVCHKLRGHTTEILPRSLLVTKRVGELLSIPHIGKAVLSFWSSGTQGSCGVPGKTKSEAERNGPSVTL